MARQRARHHFLQSPGAALGRVNNCVIAGRTDGVRPGRDPFWETTFSRIPEFPYGISKVTSMKTSLLRSPGCLFFERELPGRGIPRLTGCNGVRENPSTWL